MNDPHKAREVLKEKGFTVGKTEVVAIEVKDKPGGLAGILQVLSDHNINVEYMYAFVERSGEDAIIICRFDETDKAIDVLRKNSVTVLKGEKLYQL